LKFKTINIIAVKKAGKLQIARANAIEAYASFEHSLSNFFCDLLGTTMPKAGAVFYKLTTQTVGIKFLRI